jgi:hypothetical protein
VTFTVTGNTPRILVNMSCFKANIAPNKPTVRTNNRMILYVRNSRKSHIFVLYLDLWIFKVIILRNVSSHFDIRDKFV